MPDHVHLLLTPFRDANGATFSLVEILQGDQGSICAQHHRTLKVSGPVWQEESFDHVLRGNESFEEKLEYIRQNPVRRGLVEKPEDYVVFGFM